MHRQGIMHAHDRDSSGVLGWGWGMCWVARLQKQAWPPPPEIRRGSAELASGVAHQFGWSNGMGKVGTLIMRNHAHY